MSEKPENRYRKGSVAWSLLDSDWEDLTVPEIADALLTDPETVRSTIHRIKKDTGYAVPYKRRPKGQRARELHFYRQMGLRWEA